MEGKHFFDLSNFEAVLRESRERVSKAFSKKFFTPKNNNPAPEINQRTGRFGRTTSTEYSYRYFTESATVNQEPAKSNSDIKPDFHPVDCPPQFPSEPE